MKRMFLTLVAAIVAMGMAAVLIMHGASDRVVIGVYLFGSVGLMAVLGVFDVDEPRGKCRHMTIAEGLRWRKTA